MKLKKEVWDKLIPISEQVQYPRRTLILKEGEISRKQYFIEKGILRLWFNKDGKDITFQFFFEGSSVSSFESFQYNKPSLFNIETIEDCVLRVVDKKTFMKMRSDEIKDNLIEILMTRLVDYQMLFLSRIKDSPEERYIKLVEEHPQIVARIPQHYIASFLGISPVSLSRIRNRI